jgi:hypothetical protein
MYAGIEFNVIVLMVTFLPFVLLHFTSAHYLSSQAGFEPATLRLTAVCSAAELLRTCGAAKLLHVRSSFNYLLLRPPVFLYSLQV